MENSMSRILTEAVVKKALKDIKDSPERGIRNLVDMALQFSEGRFQKSFFSIAQTMLQNENSAYYELVRNVVSYTDTDRLYTFGMNLGYNGCTIGAQHIREHEKNLNCNIPWTVAFQLNEKHFEGNKQKYHDAIREGETLGVYVWMLFAMEHPEITLSFAQDHTDSAFCIFCQAKDLTPTFLDKVSKLYNVMLVVRYEESSFEICNTLRQRGLLYSIWYQYEQKDTETIINGDLFNSVQQLTPVFTALLPEYNCPEAIQDLVYKTVKQARNEQTYCTLLWELQGDNNLIDTIISDDACSVYFDENGDLCTWNQKIECEHRNLFHDALLEIFMSGCAKKASAS